MALNIKPLNRLQQYFQLGFNKSAKLQTDVVFPLQNRTIVKDTSSTMELVRQKFSKETDDLYRYWLDNSYDPAKSFRNRESLYDDMDVLYFSCQMITRAIELIADETIQADSNDQPIFIDAKRNVKKYIQDFFDRVNINSYLRATLIDIVNYGNAGWILGFDDNGINDIIPIEIRELKDRLEFSPYQVKQELKKGTNLFSQFNKITRLQSLIDSILDKEETTSYFKKYLLGFQVEDKVLPPWKFIHFRNMTNKSPFAPFGIPLFIHSMSAYKQFDAAMTLQNAARVASFPKQVISIKIPNQVDPATKIEKAMEAMNEWLNIGFGTSKKELPGLGDVIFTIDDLFTFQDVKVDVDLGNLGDMDYLWESLVLSTFLPRYIIDPKDSGFGDSGVALAEKFKPFARLVYRMQSILLENITQLVKIQMLYTDVFSLDDVDFTLSMKYPEGQTNPDIIASQNSLLDLANNIIQAIQDKVTGGEQLPPELLKSIYTQFLSYDTDKIEGWIDDAVKAKDNDETTPTVDSVSNQQQIDQIQFEGETPTPEENVAKQQITESLRGKRMWKLLEDQVGKMKLKERVNDIIFEEKQKTFRECAVKGKHLYSSRNRNTSFAPEMLREIALAQVDKVGKEKFTEKTDENKREELNYVFTTEAQDITINKKRKKLKETKE
jgi:hypothetical protein